MSHGESTSSLPVLPDEARAELARVLGWDEIAGSLQLASFLRFVVEEHLAGRSEQIKERTVAIRALDRESDFNPRCDCIVRVVAGKLRRALER